MAYRCFKLALNANNDHAEAYNNLGVLEWRRGRGEQVTRLNPDIQGLNWVLTIFVGCAKEFNKFCVQNF